MRPPGNINTSRGRPYADLQTVTGPPPSMHACAGTEPFRVPVRVRVKWYGYLALTGAGIASGTPPAWAVAGAALACVATPLAVAAHYGRVGLRELFLISRAPVIRRPNSEPKELT